jgi:hypothetical protein
MERYFNNFQTTVAPGGYSAGSGVLNVLSTSGISLNSGDTCRLSIYTGSPELVVILVASAVNSSTQFAVTAEGADSNASGGDLVLNTLTVGGMNQIRSDIDMTGTYANLPNPASAFLVAGQRYLQTDGPYEFIFNGSVWVPFAYDLECVLPVNSSFSWVNQGSASVQQTYGYVDLNAPSTGSTSTNLNIRRVALSAPYYADFIFTTIVGVPADAVTLGVGFRDSSSGKLLTLHALFQTGSAPEWQVNRWNSPTSYNNTELAGPPAILANGQPLYVRLHNDGSNLYMYIGNGLTWWLYYEEAVGTFLTPTDLFFFVDNSTTSGPAVDLDLISLYLH